MLKQGKNIYRRKDGRWEGRYVKEKIDGKIRDGYVFGKDYGDAQDKLRETLEKEALRDAAVLKGDGTFGSLSEEWLIIKAPQLKASSVAKYSNLLDSYLIPEFGESQTSDITRSDIFHFSRKLLVSGGIKAEGLNPKTVNAVLSLAKNILEYAKSEKGISIADIRHISVRQPQKPFRILSRDEQLRLSEFLCENPTPCHLGILLCLYTGLRIGEICALRWDDICLNEHYIHVRRTMQRIQLKREQGKSRTEVIIQEPKSSCSVRKIPIPDEILMLLQHAKRREGEAFLLTGTVGFIEPRSMENHFKSAVRECGINDINFHALRHTFATRCVEIGFDIKSLSEILGHSSVSITLNRYVHPSMELKQKNMNMLSEFLAAK